MGGAVKCEGSIVVGEARRYHGNDSRSWGTRRFLGASLYEPLAMRPLLPFEVLRCAPS